MRRADRLFQIVQLLRRRRTVTTAKEIARKLEISERTVYRDISDLVLAELFEDREHERERAVPALERVDPAEDVL